LLDLSRFVRLGILLDTHYATEEEARKTYEVNGIERLTPRSLPVFMIIPSG
jgi:hypothetical protein